MRHSCLFSTLAFLLFSSQATQAMTSFELLHINEAHHQGFTGKGVTIGIIDQAFNASHYLFDDGKFVSISNPYGQKDSHGNHVAGIAAGSYTDGANYGIATDAKIVAYEKLGVNVTDFSQLKNNHVKVVNNSHTANLKDLQKFSKENDVLVVYAAGNNSSLRPTLGALHGSGSSGNVQDNLYDLGAWLVVGNVDASHVTRDANGKLSLDARSVGGRSETGSTQLCGKVAASYCLMAAGNNILSAGYDPTEEIESGAQPGMYHGTGTSMAAPAVTGIAALVSEKYPFLGGKQLADVILSTANSDFEAPEVIYKYQRTGNTERDVIYLDGAEIPKKADGTYDYAEIIKRVNALYSGSVLGLSGSDKDSANFKVLELTKEEVFGQGIADAAKALKGLAEIDINRLKDSDVENGTAYYKLDTQGYSALFENDIDEKQYDAKYHNNDPTTTTTTTRTNAPRATGIAGATKAGFKKEGEGTLGLTGNLNYTGKTVIEKGGMALLGINEQKVLGEGIDVKSGASLFIGARVEATNSDITNAGTMTVGTDENPQHLSAKSLTNSGTLTLGDNPHSAERVKLTGKFTQQANATLNAGYLSIHNDKATNTAISATDWDVKGTVNYTPLSASGIAKSVPLALNGMESKMGSATVKLITPTGHALHYVVSTNGSGNTATLTVVPVANIYADFDGSNATIASVLVPMSGAADAISTNYSSFFRAVNASNYNFYKEALLAIDDVSHLKNNDFLMSLQSQEVLEKIINLQNGREGRFLRPRFTHLKTGDLTARQIGFDVFVNQLTPWGLGSVFANYDNFSGDLSSQKFGLGAALKNNFYSWLNILGGARLGYVKNSVKRTNQDPVKYNSFSGDIFAGIHLDWTIQSLPQTHFLPTFYVDYQYFRQQGINHPGVNYRASSIFNSIINSGYTYNGGNLFARHIRAKNMNLVSANWGLNVQQTLDAPWSLSAHAFFERRLNGKEFTTTAQFTDFPGTFEQAWKLNQNFLRFGVDVNYQAPMNTQGVIYYATLGVDYETSVGGASHNKYRAYTADFKGGMRF